MWGIASVPKGRVIRQRNFEWSGTSRTAENTPKENKTGQTSRSPATKNAIRLKFHMTSQEPHKDKRILEFHA